MAKFSDGTNISFNPMTPEEIGKELYTTFLETNNLGVFLLQEEVSFLLKKHFIPMNKFLSDCFIQMVRKNKDKRKRSDFLFRLEQTSGGWRFTVMLKQT